MGEGMEKTGEAEKLVNTRWLAENLDNLSD